MGISPERLLETIDLCSPGLFTFHTCEEGLLVNDRVIDVVLEQL